jgi:hypothetical protein
MKSNGREYSVSVDFSYALVVVTWMTPASSIAARLRRPYTLSFGSVQSRSR